MPTLPQINLSCALPSEASPVIEHFGLKLVTTRPFKIYSKANRRLIISGVGRIQCQAAVKFMSDQYDHPNRSIWINYGIAGHRELNLGTAVIADKVSTAADEKATWYPSLLFDVPCKSVCRE